MLKRGKEMLVRNKIKKLCGFTMGALFAVAGMFASMTNSAYAAGGAKLPEVTAFATPEELANGNFNLSGLGTVQKVYFGKNYNPIVWYIAGKNEDGTLALMTDNSGNFGFGALYSSGTDNKSYEGKTVYANHYGASGVRLDLLDKLSSFFSEEERRHMADSSIWTPDAYNDDEPYQLTDKLYLPYGGEEDDCFYVGNNSADEFSSGLMVSFSCEAVDSDTFPFWLRSPHMMGSYVQYADTNNDCLNYTDVDDDQSVRPVFHLDLSDVIFASSAAAASSSGNLSDTMTFRIENDGKFASTAAVNGQTISVSYDNDDSGVFLYVQGNDGRDWVKVVEINSSEEYSLSDLNLSEENDLSKCQVWLEKFDADDNLVYASYADGGNNKGGSNGNEPDPNCNHDFVWQTITSATLTSYGTEGNVCTKCGAKKSVCEKSPLDGWAALQIRKAKSGDVLTMDFGPWNSYPLWMMKMIADKNDVIYIIKYTYQDQKYEVTIKPGDKFELDCDWYGPLKMPTLFDTVTTEL